MMQQEPGAPERPTQSGHALAAAAALLAAAVLSGCGPQPGVVDVDLGSGPPVAPFADDFEGGGFAAGAFADDPLLLDPAPLAAADPLIASVPAAGTAAGARRLLPNETALPGENFVTRVPGGGLGRQSVAGTLARAGALPSPFEFAIARDFAPVPGAPGAAYVFATPMEGVACVLAVAPAGGDALLMRNCVRGGTAEALAPLARAAVF